MSTASLLTEKVNKATQMKKEIENMILNFETSHEISLRQNTTVHNLSSSKVSERY
jgi:hypothetical protein